MSPKWVNISFVALIVLIAALGPPVTLVLTWRRWGSRKRLAIAFVMLPFAVFLICGSLGAIATLISNQRTPPRSFESTPAFAFGGIGAYSEMFCGVVAMFWIPGAIAWRFFH